MFLQSFVQNWLRDRPYREPSARASIGRTRAKLARFSLIPLLFIGVAFTPGIATAKTLYVFDLERYFESEPERTIDWQYDVLRLVAGLQGLVNRPVAPVESGRSVPDAMLYVLFMKDAVSGHARSLDSYWLEYLGHPGRLLADFEIKEVLSLEELLGYPDIAEHVQGAVLWDERVPATANVATTICGVESLLPIRHVVGKGTRAQRSLHRQLIDQGPALKIGATLSGKFLGYGDLPDTTQGTKSRGSTKYDTYRWVIEQYLEPGRCSNLHLGYYLDGIDWDPETPGWQCSDLANSGVLNTDFYVSEKALIFDLDPWWSEIAPDESEENKSVQQIQGLDEDNFTTILRTIYRNRQSQGFASLGGFVPWFLKYTTESPERYRGPNDPVKSEYELLALATAHNAYVEGDAYALAGLANASVFRHVRLETRYEQNLVPSRAQVESEVGDVDQHVYLLLYMGGFDSPAWISQAIPTLWDDTYRGRIDLAWGFSPTAAVRAAPMFEYVYNTRTDRDYFVGGDSGAGYVHPRYLVKDREHSGYDTAIAAWVKFNRKLYRRFDYQVTGLVINGAGGPLNAILQRPFFHFSPHGVVSQVPFFQPLSDGVVPFTKLRGDLSLFDMDPDDIAARIGAEPVAGLPDFQAWRCIMTTPTNLYFAIRELKQKYPNRNYEVVDPYTFFYLLREAEGGSNYYLGLVWQHDIPTQMEASRNYHSRVLLRNDGWDTWNETGTPPEKRYRLVYDWLLETDRTRVLNRATTYIRNNVETGEKVEVQIDVEAPAEEGLYRLRLYVQQEDQGNVIPKFYEDLLVYVSGSATP